MSAFEERLNAMRSKFIARAQGEAGAIRQGCFDEDREGLLELAHKMSGLAGMLGYSNISSAAAKLEVALAGERGETEVEHARGQLLDEISRL